MVLRTSFFFTLLLAWLPALAQVTEFQLSNGMKVIVKEDHRAPVVVSQVWYLARAMSPMV